MDGLEMKPSVLAASLGKRLMTRASRMRRAGIEPKFSRDFRAIAQLTEPKFRVSDFRFLDKYCHDGLLFDYGLRGFRRRRVDRISSLRLYGT